LHEELLLNKKINFKIEQERQENSQSALALSDHNTQLLKLENVIAPIQEFVSCYVRNSNNDPRDNVNPSDYLINPSNAELNPICHLLALLA
jgi:hypothetical protein